MEHQSYLVNKVYHVGLKEWLLKEYMIEWPEMKYCSYVVAMQPSTFLTTVIGAALRTIRVDYRLLVTKSMRTIAKIEKKEKLCDDALLRCRQILGDYIMIISNTIELAHDEWPSLIKDLDEAYEELYSIKYCREIKSLSTQMNVDLRVWRSITPFLTDSCGWYRTARAIQGVIRWYRALAKGDPIRSIHAPLTEKEFATCIRIHELHMMTYHPLTDVMTQGCMWDAIKSIDPKNPLKHTLLEPSRKMMKRDGIFLISDENHNMAVLLGEKGKPVSGQHVSAVLQRMWEETGVLFHSSLTEFNLTAYIEPTPYLCDGGLRRPRNQQHRGPGFLVRRFQALMKLLVEQQDEDEEEEEEEDKNLLILNPVTDIDQEGCAKDEQNAVSDILLNFLGELAKK
jgi:hypothetical protein